MLIQNISRNAIPGADAETCEYILWEKTPYPAGDVTPRSLYRAAARYRRACANGRITCEFCNNLATDNTTLCGACNDALRRPH